MSFTINSSLFSTMSDLASQMSSLNSSRSMIRSYYSQLKAADSSSNSSTATNNSTTSTNTGSSKIKTMTADLKTSADKLTDTKTASSLFVADENGDYDMDKITSAVSDFVDKYNDVASAVAKSGNSAVQNQSSLLNKMAGIFSNRLNNVGITVNNDGTMTVDKDKLADADIEDLKSLFNGTKSYAGWVSDKTSTINTAADTSDFNKTYSSTGISSLFSNGTSGSIFDYLT